MNKDKYEATAYEISVAIAAPNPEYIGINVRFNTTLTKAPRPCVISENISKFSISIHLLNAALMNMNIADQICIDSIGADSK